MYRKILVPLSAGATGIDGAFGGAVHIARGFGSQIEVLYARPNPENLILVLGKGFAGTVLEDALREAQAKTARDCRAVHERLRRLCRDADVPLFDAASGSECPEVVWRATDGHAGDLVATAGRFADLIVVSKPGDEDEDGGTWRTMLDAALFATARPVLLMPPRPVQSIGSRAVIAWNGGPQATRAVAAALPLLRQARSVLIATVGADVELQRDAELLKDYLLVQGIEAQPSHLPGSPQEAGDVLLDLTMETGADLLVMGAHGHGRLREWALGSTTSYVVNFATVPVLVAH